MTFDKRPSWEKYSAKEWAQALQGLTPGGSEFQTPEECVAFVRKRTNYPQIIIRLRSALKDLSDSILNVGSILPDDMLEKPSVIYGHPSNEQWFQIFMKARKAKQENL